MQLSSRQTRIYRLAILLGSSKPLPAASLLDQLHCSRPTLMRALKELREDWDADIKYHPASASYQMAAAGKLDKKCLRRFSEMLKSDAQLQHHENLSRVFLDKQKKKAVSLSLRMSVLNKIDRVTHLTEISRSEVVEMLVESGLDELIKRLKAQARCGKS